MTLTNPLQDQPCDLCGQTRPLLLREATDTRNRTVVCPRCRLIYASPRPTAEALRQHYEQEFRGDAGGQARTGDGQIGDKYVKTEEMRAKQWAVPLVQRFTSIAGKDVLDLRCQTGALAAALAEQGAHVVPVDPFEANLKYASEVRGLARTTRIPIWQFHELPGEDNSFDVVTALNEHVPGHVLFCRQFLDRIYALLRPNGYLFLDEKDVLRPTRFKVPSLLDTGAAHVYHLMPHTLRGYLQAAGFEIVECQLDKVRRSTFRHFRAVAQKPATGIAGSAPQFAEGPSVKSIFRHVWLSEQRWQWTRARRFVKRGFRRAA